MVHFAPIPSQKTLPLPVARPGELPRFGNALAKEALYKAVGDSAVDRLSDAMYPFFRKIGQWDIGKVGGLALEDWAARFLTLFGLYIPQGLIAIKQDSHKWETNGRNVFMWILNIAVVSFAKNDKYGLNTLLNNFMKDKTTADSKTWIGRLVSKFGLEGDYFKALAECGIKTKAEDRAKAFWASMDSNMMDSLVAKYNGLFEKQAAGKVLNDAEKGLHKLLGQFLNRRNAFNLASTTVITLATMYLIGKLAMDFVFTFIAPLDHDFEPMKRGGHGAPAQKPQRQPQLPTFPAQQYPAYPQNGPHQMVMNRPPVRAMAFGAFQQELQNAGRHG